VANSVTRILSRMFTAAAIAAALTATYGALSVHADGAYSCCGNDGSENCRFLDSHAACKGGLDCSGVYANCCTDACNSL
jgi:hypothetical protein